MATALNKTSFISGEVSPTLFGHTDLAREQSGLATERNCFVGYQGGAFSRAGTAFVGFSKQTGRAFPPRMINFQFSINQGLALEFGHLYMRVVFQGAYVTEAVLAITGATQASPCHVSAAASGGNAATPNNGGVIASYAPGEVVTLAGGVFTVPMQIAVLDTTLLGVEVTTPGLGVYAPHDTITLAGGTQTAAPVVTLTSTLVTAATVAVAGGSGTPGPAVVTGTTGTGTKFQANVTIGSGGTISSVDSILVAGDYTVNPAAPAAEPVTGGGLVGAMLNLQIGVLGFTLTTPGVFTANAPSGVFTQASTSGAGTGAVFGFGLFAPNAVSVAQAGTYTTFPPNPVAQASSSGGGQGVTFTVSTVAVTPFNDGDWVFIEGVGGMDQLNGRTFVVENSTTAGFDLFDVFGDPIDSTGFDPYTSGGTAARIFTLVTPYAEQDLKYLKFTQSADVMSLACVNQETSTEYPIQDLNRLSDNQWTLTPVITAPSIGPPNIVTDSFTSQGNTFYEYSITSVAADGTESVQSEFFAPGGAVDIAATAGTIFMSWTSVPGAVEYNVYKAQPSQGGYPPVGSLFGYAGSVYGTQFKDSNVVADYTQVPPTHKNPFARGQVIQVNPTAGGGGYTFAVAQPFTFTGSGANIVGVIENGQVTSYIIEDAGENYENGVSFQVIGDGSGAAASGVIGPQTGTYPSVVAYFQERRVYANTLNNPDTYFMSQPGAFKNYDVRLPTIDTDAITGSPWSVQVDGIQFMVQTAGGLLTFTGKSTWLLVGSGSFATNVQAISPSSQVATPQPASGCSATLPPIPINYDVLFVTSKGSRYYDLPYQLYALSEPIDLTQYSSHMFVGYDIVEHAWCEQPNKLVWAVRSDGALLSLTYLKVEQVSGWARHDTNGLFKSVCSVTEPPVDALYLAVERNIGGKTAYTVERMDNRIWTGGVESTWCVDCGLSLPQPQPNASLSASSGTGLGAVTGATGLVGGVGYSPGTVATVIDAPFKAAEKGGPGTGAVPTLTIVGGVITGISFPGGQQGALYQNPQIVFNDPAGSAGGSGASATLILDTTATFTASAPVFATTSVGNVIRMGGGAATITQFLSSTSVIAQITTPITATQPNSGTPPAVQAQPAGSWTLSEPVASVFVPHLVGATVTGLADGNVIPPVVVPADGMVDLSTTASAVTIGLGFQAQIQSVYLDSGEPTIQGQRKKIAAVTARLSGSRGVVMGSNQPDGSTFNPIRLAPEWSDLEPIPDSAVRAYNQGYDPLFTGDTRIPINGGWQTKGQVCLQQDNPLPMEVLSFSSELLEGDTPEQKITPRQKQAGR